MDLIKFEMKELSKDSGLLVNDFISEIGSIIKILESINKDLNPDKTPQITYKILKIRKNSPLYVEIKPEVKDQDSAKYIRFFYDGIKKIPLGKTPDNFSVNTLRAYSEIGKSIQRNRLTFIENGKKSRISIDKNFEECVNEINGKSYYAEMGSVAGKLDALNLHGTKKTITIYPNYSPAINCIVGDDLLNIVEKAVRKKVTVTGKIRTRVGEQYPFEIIIHEIKIHKSINEIPKLEELWGMINSQTIS